MLRPNEDISRYFSMRDGVLGKYFKSGKVAFYCGNKKLDFKFFKNDPYLWGTIKDLKQQKQKASWLTLKGKGNGLEEMLLSEEGLTTCTGLLVSLLSRGVRPVHINVDVEKLNNAIPGEVVIIQYPKKWDYTKGILPVKEILSISKDFGSFEKVWHNYLEGHIAGWVGSPGYEAPASDKEWKACFLEHYANFPIGTKAQLKKILEKTTQKEIKKVLYRIVRK